eukprot:Em0013g115a
MAQRFGALRLSCASTSLRGQYRTLWDKSEKKHAYPSGLPHIVNYNHVSRTLVSQAQGVAKTAEESGTVAKPIGYPWRIVSAVCVQRFPTLSRQKTPFELEFEEHKDIKRAERSRLSNHELTLLDYARKRAERDKKALAESLDDTQLPPLEGNDEFDELQESREAEVGQFRPAPRETLADLSDDKKSLHRKLDRVLYLLVKKARQEHAWQMPQGGLEKEESLAQAAVRELREECGSGLNVKFLSGAPALYFSYLNPAPSPAGLIGSKVFFIKAQYLSGNVVVDNSELDDYVWVTKDEMKGYVSDEYYKKVAPVLID